MVGQSDLPSGGGHQWSLEDIEKILGPDAVAKLQEKGHPSNQESTPNDPEPDKKAQETPAGKPETPFQRAMRTAREHFDSADLDNTGSLDAFELAAVMKKLAKALKVPSQQCSQ